MQWWVDLVLDEALSQDNEPQNKESAKQNIFDHLSTLSLNQWWCSMDQTWEKSNVHFGNKQEMIFQWARIKLLTLAT